VKRFQYVRAALRRPAGAIGFVILVAVLAVAYLGRFLATNSPTATLGPGGTPSGPGLPLGSDYLGRDVLSRVLHGGTSAITMAVLATVSAYVLGLAVGIIAGYFGGAPDMALMRAVDIILAFPPLMVLLLLVGGFSNHVWVLVLGVVIVQLPSISRIARAAAQSIRHSEFVDAARARGDGLITIWRRDLLANISSVLLADFGIRFGISIILIASMNFLGLGLTPPASDWGLMISENKDLLSINPWAVLAPAIMLALITVGLNLFADAYVRSVNAGSSGLQLADDVVEEIAAGTFRSTPTRPPGDKHESGLR
jgi:ABC-type dipeptide/oligopeptide/nickel transport system permease subunit